MTEEYLGIGAVADRARDLSGSAECSDCRELADLVEKLCMKLLLTVDHLAMFVDSPDAPELRGQFGLLHPFDDSDNTRRSPEGPP